MMRSFLKLAAPLSILTACSSFLPQATPKEVFILASTQERFCDVQAVKGNILNIIEQDSPDFFRTQKIIFRQNFQLGSYQLAEWAEPVPLRIERLISERLRCQGYQIGGSAEPTDRQGILVKFTVLDFSHEASVPPGKFKGVFRIIKTTGSNIQDKLFSFESDVQTYNVEGAREAADRVVEQLLIQITDFLS